MKRIEKTKRKMDGKGVMDSSRAHVDGEPYKTILMSLHCATKSTFCSPAVEIYFCLSSPCLGSTNVVVGDQGTENDPNTLFDTLKAREHVREERAQYCRVQSLPRSACYCFSTGMKCQSSRDGQKPKDFFKFLTPFLSKMIPLPRCARYLNLIMMLCVLFLTA